MIYSQSRVKTLHRSAHVAVAVLGALYLASPKMVMSTTNALDDVGDDAGSTEYKKLVAKIFAGVSGLLVALSLVEFLLSFIVNDRMTCPEATKVIALGCLALVDEITDVLSCITFYKVGAMGFFKVSLGILIFSALAEAIFSHNYNDNYYRIEFAGFMVGLLGLAPIVESFMDVAVRGGETADSGYAKLLEAICESSTQTMLQVLFLTYTLSWRDTWDSTPDVVVSAAISFLSLSFQFAMYPVQAPAVADTTAFSTSTCWSMVTSRVMVATIESQVAAAR